MGGAPWKTQSLFFPFRRGPACCVYSDCSPACVPLPVRSYLLLRWEVAWEGFCSNPDRSDPSACFNRAPPSWEMPCLLVNRSLFLSLPFRHSFVLVCVRLPVSFASHWSFSEPSFDLVFCLWPQISQCLVFPPGLSPSLLLNHTHISSFPQATVLHTSFWVNTGPTGIFF